MNLFHRSQNTFAILSSICFFVSYSLLPASASQRYPYYLPKCCESKGRASADGNSTSSDEGPIWPCGSEMSEVLLLPKQLFNAITTKLERVEVESRNLAEGLQCDHGRGFSDSYKYFTLEYDSFTENYFDQDGRLFLRGSTYLPSQFCIRSVSHNALSLRMCHKEDWVNSGVKSSPVGWLEFSVLIIKIVTLMASVLFYVAIAGVYIQRKDKEPVFRSSIVAFSISMTLACILFTCFLNLGWNYLNQTLPIDIFRIVASALLFFQLYGYSWMSVLCFDVWLHITFLRLGREAGKRLWGYVVFTFTLPTIFLGVFFITILLDKSPNHTEAIFISLGYLLCGSAIAFLCLNFLLFIATAVKLWISQFSSDINNQKKTFMLYFKLFILVRLRWVGDSILVFLLTMLAKDDGNEKGWRFILLEFVAYCLLLLHPIGLFFFFVWDATARRYLEANYPRVKRVISGI